MAVWSCGWDTGARRTADWTVSDSAGVAVVSNHPQSLSRGCITVTPDPETTIGSGVERSDPVPSLFNVRGGAVLSDGRIVVLNAGSRELLFYDANGTYEYAVGGAGRGPGEFRDPTWLGHGNADTLFVWDAGLARISTFDETGALLTSRQVGFEGGGHIPSGISGRFEDGSFLASPGPLVFFTGAEKGVTRLSEAYQRYDPETDHTNYLADGRSLEMVVGGGGAYSLPFGKRDLAVAYGTALLVADNGVSAVRLYGMNGQLRRVIEWVSEPDPVTRRDELAYTRYMATASSRFALPANAPFADERPRFSSIDTDRTGWIWVRSFAAAWEPPAPWWIFDGNGVLQCEVRAPGRITVLEIGEGYLLARQRDELGEERVARFYVVRNGLSEDVSVQQPRGANR